MKPYKLKHIPSGMYYQPHKHGGSNLSEKGKVYQSGTHGLSEAFRRMERNPDNDTFKVWVKRNSRVHLKLKDWTWIEGKYSKDQLYSVTKVMDWKREELKL